MCGMEWSYRNIVQYLVRNFNIVTLRLSKIDCLGD